MVSLTFHPLVEWKVNDSMLNIAGKLKNVFDSGKLYRLLVGCATGPEGVGLISEIIQFCTNYTCEQKILKNSLRKFLKFSFMKNKFRNRLNDELYVNVSNLRPNIEDVLDKRNHLSSFTLKNKWEFNLVRSSTWIIISSICSSLFAY